MLEGSVSTLKGQIKVEKEEISKYLVIPDFVINDVHIEIDSFLSLTRNGKLIQLDHELKHQYTSWIKA